MNSFLDGYKLTYANYTTNEWKMCVDCMYKGYSDVESPIIKLSYERAAHHLISLIKDLSESLNAIYTPLDPAQKSFLGNYYFSTLMLLEYPDNNNHQKAYDFICLSALFQQTIYPIYIQKHIFYSSPLDTLD